MWCFRIRCDEERSSPLNEDRDMLFQYLPINDIARIFRQEIRSTAAQDDTNVPSFVVRT